MSTATKVNEPRWDDEVPRSATAQALLDAQQNLAREKEAKAKAALEKLAGEVIDGALDHEALATRLSDLGMTAEALAAEVDRQTEVARLSKIVATFPEADAKHRELKSQYAANETEMGEAMKRHSAVAIRLEREQTLAFTRLQEIERARRKLLDLIPERFARVRELEARIQSIRSRIHELNAEAGIGDINFVVQDPYFGKLTKSRRSTEFLRAEAMQATNEPEAARLMALLRGFREEIPQREAELREVQAELAKARAEADASA